MQTDIGMIVGGIFLVIVGIFWVVEQRRSVKTYNAEVTQTRAENRELIELQRETNRSGGCVNTFHAAGDVSRLCFRGIPPATGRLRHRTG